MIAAADPTAQALGLRLGVPLARAQAAATGLLIAEADPAGDATALRQAAAWCLGLAPLTAPDPPDGIWIDATGCAHLRGGEAAMLAQLVTGFGRAGSRARAAVADTPGAAWAAARYGRGEAVVVPPGAAAAAVLPLPVEALRLPSDTLDALRRLGFDRVGQLAAAPRGPLALRFGADVLRRLDQALGRVAEPITPVVPPELVSHRLAFAEPLLTAEAFSEVIGLLARAVCAALERAGQGARRLDLLFERVEGAVQAVRVGTAKPVRDAGHIGRLLDERLEEVDPGLGVEAMRLVVPLSELLAYAQPSDGLAAAPTPDVSALVDRLLNRLGPGRVYRVAPVESDVPERAVRRVPALSGPGGASWPAALPRPSRLLSPPQPVEATALLPDQPPVQFTWRRVLHRVRHADGPERIYGEWWRRDGERAAVRDYFAVEDDAGRRFWLYRRGDGVDPATGDLRWFLHGLF